ncbi:MAG: hypothetical protein J6M39_08925 [Lachnospiraceae bacterium]|nr:hypothetical protein [Lachnospiraceae bacterium]
MIITNINWIDQNNKEAIVTISDSRFNIVCFADNLRYKIGDKICERLNALCINDIKRISNNNHYDVKMKDTFNCKIIAKLCNNKSILKIGNIIIDITGCYLPNDLNDNDLVEAELSRVDLY